MSFLPWKGPELHSEAWHKHMGVPQLSPSSKGGPQSRECRVHHSHRRVLGDTQPWGALALSISPSPLTHLTSPGAFSTRDSNSRLARDLPAPQPLYLF